MCLEQMHHHSYCATSIFWHIRVCVCKCGAVCNRILCPLDVPIYTSMVIGIPMGAVVLLTMGFTLYRRLRLKWMQSQTPMELEEYQ